MKTFRKIVKLLPPAFVMRIWLDKRYGIKVPPSPWGEFAGFVLAVLPYAFTAALSVRVESDRRLLKYFLPYGRMKKFVNCVYNMQVGNQMLDKGLCGKLRAFVPYGLVLWWDSEDARIAAEVSARMNAKAEHQLATLLSPVASRCIPEREREELQRMDRVEAMTLRVLMLTNGKVLISNMGFHM